MKMSNLFVQTLREFPSDAEVISHKMLARAGYIKKLTSTPTAVFALVSKTEALNCSANFLTSSLDIS